MGTQQHGLPDEPLQPHQARPFTLPHVREMYGQLSRRAGAIPGPRCPRASLTAITPSSQPSANTAHPKKPAPCRPAPPPRTAPRRPPRPPGRPLARGYALRLQEREQPQLGNLGYSRATGGVSHISANDTCCVSLRQQHTRTRHERAPPAPRSQPGSRQRALGPGGAAGRALETGERSGPADPGRSEAEPRANVAKATQLRKRSGRSVIKPAQRA